jgi:hypothetical protein
MLAEIASGIVAAEVDRLIQRLASAVCWAHILVGFPAPEAAP